VGTRSLLLTCVSAALAAATLVACSHPDVTTTTSSATHAGRTAHQIASGPAATTTSPGPSTTLQPLPALRSVPRFAHIVVVVMENHDYADVIGNSQAPYLNSLAQQGLSLTQSYAVTHPSEPNYLALFSGSTRGLTSDACITPSTGPNLASELTTAGYTFTGYSESLPSAGYSGCSSGAYARKHNPWATFTNLPPSINQPFTAFPSDYNQLPTVSFVIPNLTHDMHDGTIKQGDQWLHDNLGGYVNWAYSHHSLMIVTWDENDGAKANQIPTIFVGAGLLSGTDDTRITHYTVLRTIEDSYGLPLLGASSVAQPLTADWQ
jgi:hypothetical protein